MAEATYPSSLILQNTQTKSDFDTCYGLLYALIASGYLWLVIFALIRWLLQSIQG
jgi:hypothetical protein